MAEFTTFFGDMLASVASFLWSDSIKWIIGCIVLLFIIKIIRAILQLGRKEKEWKL